MNTRLKQFLAAENISQAQFADSINVVRASVSHVLSGRNNPSYDFIKATMGAFPSLNIEWLMLGKGKMYKDDNAPQITLQEDTIPFPDFEYEENIEAMSEINTLDNVTQRTEKQRKISKVIVLFDDGTFQEM